MHWSNQHNDNRSNCILLQIRSRHLVSGSMNGSNTARVPLQYQLYMGHLITLNLVQPSIKSTTSWQCWPLPQKSKCQNLAQLHTKRCCFVIYLFLSSRNTLQLQLIGVHSRQQRFVLIGQLLKLLSKTTELTKKSVCF